MASARHTYPAEGVHTFINFSSHDQIDEGGNVAADPRVDAAIMDCLFHFPVSPGTVGTCPEIGSRHLVGEHKYQKRRGGELEEPTHAQPDHEQIVTALNGAKSILK